MELKLSRQTSLNSFELDGVRYHMQVKNSPFQLVFSFEQGQIGNFKEEDVDCSLVYDDPERKPVGFVKEKPVVAKVSAIESSKVSLEARIKVLTSQLEGSLFRVAVTITSLNVVGYSDPIKIISKSDQVKRKTPEQLQQQNKQILARVAAQNSSQTVPSTPMTAFQQQTVPSTPMNNFQQPQSQQPPLPTQLPPTPLQPAQSFQPAQPFQNVQSFPNPQAPILSHSHHSQHQHQLYNQQQQQFPQQQPQQQQPPQQQFVQQQSQQPQGYVQQFPNQYQQIPFQQAIIVDDNGVPIAFPTQQSQQQQPQQQQQISQQTHQQQQQSFPQQPQQIPQQLPQQVTRTSSENSTKKAKMSPPAAVGSERTINETMMSIQRTNNELFKDLLELEESLIESSSVLERMNGGVGKKRNISTSQQTDSDLNRSLETFLESFSSLSNEYSEKKSKLLMWCLTSNNELSNHFQEFIKLLQREGQSLGKLAQPVQSQIPLNINIKVENDPQCKCDGCLSRTEGIRLEEFYKDLFG